MYKKIFIYCLFCSICFCLPRYVVASSNNASLPLLLNELDALHLHESKRWLALLHYRRLSFANGFSSEADDPKFFLSSQGLHNPKLELVATITAFVQSTLVDDEHPQCRFPARLRWLQTMLPQINEMLPPQKCKALENWKKKFQSDEVTLIFAESYLNNPASVFGHTFLRFDRKNPTKSNSHLTAPTVSYVAEKSAISNMYDYLVGGLISGIPGIIDIVPYYRKLKEYSDIEHRDIWEYTLDLRPEEIEAMIFHIWELKKINFDYFFIDENCAYRVISIIEAVKPGLDIAKLFSARTIPVETIEALDRAGLIKRSRYRPSSITAFYSHEKQLSRESKKYVVNFSAHDFDVNPNDINAIVDKNRTLMTASEYLSILANKGGLSRKFANRRNHQILSHVDIPSDSDIINAKPETPAQTPLQAHASHRINIAMGKRQDQAYVDSVYRYAYHDLTDPNPGFPIGAQIELLKVQIRKYQGSQPILQKLSIIEMESLTPVNRYFFPASWRFAVGRERYQSGMESTGLYNFVDVGIGLSVEKFKTLFYGLFTTTLEYDGEIENKHTIRYGLKTGVLYRYHRNVGNIVLLLSNTTAAGHRVDKSINWKHSISLTKSFSMFFKAGYEKRPYLNISPNMSPNLSANIKELSVGLAHYF